MSSRFACWIMTIATNLMMTSTKTKIRPFKFTYLKLRKKKQMTQFNYTDMQFSNASNFLYNHGCDKDSCLSIIVA